MVIRSQFHEPFWRLGGLKALIFRSVIEFAITKKSVIFRFLRVLLLDFPSIGILLLESVCKSIIVKIYVLSRKIWQYLGFSVGILLLCFSKIQYFESLNVSSQNTHK